MDKRVEVRGGDIGTDLAYVRGVVNAGLPLEVLPRWARGVVWGGVAEWLGRNISRVRVLVVAEEPLCILGVEIQGEGKRWVYVRHGGEELAGEFGSDAERGKVVELTESI